MALTHVLSPLRIADCELKNRVVRTAHGTHLGGGVMNDDLIAYHLARGQGGVGLTIIEILGVHPSTPSTLNAFAPGIGDGYRKLVEQVKPTGMKLFQQLWHAGHNTTPIDGSPPWSASDRPGFTVDQPGQPMSKGMINDAIGAYAETARRCAEWGLDGIEVHAAHGYLPAQFLSPVHNDRVDEYGGSFDNRIRFLVEVMTAVRAAVPPGFPVGVRLAPDRMTGSIGVEDTLRAGQCLDTRKLIDFANISLGNYQNFAKMIGGMHEPAGYEMPTSAPIARGLTVPSIVTGRFRTLEEADAVIRAGDAAMVSFVRALIADPDLVNKTAKGQADRVRPCIACNQGCLARAIELPYRMGCAVNPGAGFELTLGDNRLSSAPSPRRILIVGGGPAGMEAARIAALRGHKVTLMEASARLGGSVIAAARAPTRHGIADITNWLEREIFALEVDVRLSTYVEAGDIVPGEWDEIIIATGSRPRMDGVQMSNPGEPAAGMDLPHVLNSSELLLSPEGNFGEDAVVVDDTGHYEALSAAEYLASRGVRVAFVTRHISVAPRMESAQMVEPALTRLAGTGFTVHNRSRALRIERDRVIIAPTYLPATTNLQTALKAETVVFVSHNRGNRELFDALRTRGVAVRVVGDAASARYLPTAISEGHRAGAAV